LVIVCWYEMLACATSWQTGGSKYTRSEGAAGERDSCGCGFTRRRTWTQQNIASEHVAIPVNSRPLPVKEKESVPRMRQSLPQDPRIE